MTATPATNAVVERCGGRTARRLRWAPRGRPGAAETGRNRSSKAAAAPGADASGNKLSRLEESRRLPWRQSRGGRSYRSSAWRWGTVGGRGSLSVPGQATAHRQEHHRRMLWTQLPPAWKRPLRLRGIPAHERLAPPPQPRYKLVEGVTRGRVTDQHHAATHRPQVVQCRQHAAGRLKAVQRLGAAATCTGVGTVLSAACAPHSLPRAR